MKRFSFLLCIITFSLILCSCNAVSITSADEMVSNVWYIKNTNEVSAELSFDVPSNTANFEIIDQYGDAFKISGVFAIDKEKLYITSTELAKTYSFGYEVFKDRLILSFEDTEITFMAKEKSRETTAPTLNIRMFLRENRRFQSNPQHKVQ